jgi:hypothetical protein
MKTTATILVILLSLISFKVKSVQPDTVSVKTHFYSPFDIKIDPMERLLLITFLNDPDSIYTGLEPQVFDDPVNGTGMLVIAWRTDGYIDVYHQPSLTLNRAKYDIAGKGLANMSEVEMDGAYFRVEENGIQAWFHLTDIYDRTIEVKINENHPSKRKPFGLLAPMGDAAESPSAMPMVLLHNFYFVRKNHTEHSIKINDQNHKPDNFPMRMDGKKMFFTRYSPDPLIATLNPSHNGILQAIEMTELSNSSNNATYKILNKNGRHYMERFEKNLKDHTLQMSFYPPLPCITSLAEGEKISGKFTIEGDPSTGKIGGTYYIYDLDGKIHAGLTPSDGWKPRPNKLSLRFLYTVAGVFKNWPKSYHWSAEITMDDNAQPTMVSHWERKRK